MNERRALIGALGLVTLLGAAATARAEEQSASPATDHSEENRPESELEAAVMSELACVCGGCQLEPIDECTCPFAARMRGQVKQELASHDLTTPEARDRAHREVRATFVAEYGEQVLRQPEKTASLGAWLGPIAGIAVGLIVLVIVAIRVSRRRKPLIT